MENLDNIRYMLQNKAPDLTPIKEEIARLINSENFKLRDVQLEALAIICKYGVLLGNIGVGHGKTFISLLARLVTRSKRCLLFVPNDLIPQLTQEDIPTLEKFLGVSLDWCTIDGVEKMQRVEMMDKHSLTIIPYSLLSTDDTYEVLEASFADMIIFDECFTGDTMVQTSRGEKRIDKVDVGDIIVSATGYAPVTGISKRLANKLYNIRFSNGKSIRCTGNHPFLSTNGWITAEKMERKTRVFCLQNMPRLWESFSTQFSKKRRRNTKLYDRQKTVSTKEILFELLYHESEQSYEFKRDKRKGINDFKKSWAQAVNSWWQWNSKRITNEVSQHDKHSNTRVHSGNNNINKKFKSGKEIPYLLQGRHRKCAIENSNRTGRSFTWTSLKASTGQKKRRISKIIRVESITIEECRGGENVYNLEVGQHPSYFANGFLVHNCQMIKNKKSARTGRIESYWNRNPHINLVFLSGTVAKNSIMDYHHLITRGLHKWSTIPYSWYEAKQIQDATAYDNESEVAQCWPLIKINPALELDSKFQKGMVNVVEARKFVRTLLKSSPCVIMTENQAVSCALKVNHIDDGKLPKELIDKIAEVDKTWTTPNGDLIDDHIVKYQICSQLADGFWYRLFWPTGTPQWAIDLHKMKREVESAIKSFILMRHRDKLDTPFLVYGALARRDEKVREFQGLYDAYIKFKSGFKDADQYKRDRETIWINKDKEKIALKWCKGRKKGIIWYEHQATGESLFETLKANGVNVIHCPAACPITDLKMECIQLMSFSHIKGKNLQHQFENLLYNMSESAADLEQLMGRTPREGQKSDYVQYDFVICTEQDKDHFRKLILQAFWQRDSFGDQKILIADYSKPDYIHGIRGNTPKNSQKSFGFWPERT